MSKSTASFKKTIKCICPRCGKVHKRRIFWTGKGTPRFYCPNCKEGNLSEDGLHPVDNGEIERVLNKTNNDMMEELWA